MKAVNHKTLRLVRRYARTVAEHRATSPIEEARMRAAYETSERDRLAAATSHRERGAVTHRLRALLGRIDAMRALLGPAFGAVRL